MHELNITLFRRSGSDIYIMQYRDPISGRKRRKTTGTKSLRKAERIAGDWEKKIRDGKDWTRGRMPWSEFRRQYEENRLEGLAPSTAKKSISVLNVLDRVIAPQKLHNVNSDTLDDYQAKLRKLKRSEHTIKSHLAHIRSALSWAFEKGWIAGIPKMPKIQRAKALKVMKGRAITTEEYERYVAAVGKIIVEPNKGRASKRKDRLPDYTRIPSWEKLIHGLWLSGLRLGESMELHWTDQTKFRVDFSQRHAMFRIPSESEKGNEDRILPIAPEFALWLEQTPKEQRRGFVFNPMRQNKGTQRLSVQTVGRTLVDIGEKSNVKVDTSKTGKPIFVSAHDLRRSFGERWAGRIMPKELMELMRHKSINTTMMYYVGQNAERTAGVLWEAYRSYTDKLTQTEDLGAEMGAKSNSPETETAKSG